MLRIIQANLRKGRENQLSLLNDISLANHDLLMISEPCIFNIEGHRTTHTHNKWQPILPPEKRDANDGLAPTRSMIWIKKGMGSFQEIDTDSSDITAITLPINNQHLLVVSVYVPPGNGLMGSASLQQTTRKIREICEDQQKKYGGRVDILIAGDFNRHDSLWGGDQVADSPRQGEALPLLELIIELGLESLLPRGTITYESGPWKTTIDLTLASIALSRRKLMCHLHQNEHGSDHRVIETIFEINSSPSKPLVDLPNYCLRKAPWDKIQDGLQQYQWEHQEIGNPESLEINLQSLMGRVTKVIAEHTPVVRPSPYCKRWWTEELSKIREEYSMVKNQCTRFNRYGISRPDLIEHARLLRQRYHTAIRNQKRRHWEEFLEDRTNIWQAAQYAKNRDSFGLVPTLHSGHTTVETDSEKAKLLLQAFFPPLPRIQYEEIAEFPAPLIMAPLTDKEIETAAMNMNKWKAPGQDKLPVVVWQKLWPVIGTTICNIFRTSVRLGYIPNQWKVAKIIPLRKPDRDYTQPNSYRPISLLSTLGKILEATVATRISHLVETNDLLPQNHFGARRRRSGEQALNILIEKIYEAWRNQKVLSLVSFDVKGAYNGVAKEVLLQRMQQRRIPRELVQWVNAFCSNRRASMIVNQHCSEEMEILHPGLPQGSPLSPILYLFFNAGLVETPINQTRGAIAFVDDYNHWVVGPSAEENTARIQAKVIPTALRWAAQSGATFEAQKTTFIHFTKRKTLRQLPALPLKIGQQEVATSTTAKILGVILDQELRFKEHVGRITKRGIKAVQALARLKGLTSQTARQLYNALVVPRITYAASAWASINKNMEISYWITKPLAVVQKTAAKVITGTLRTVSIHIAEAEACINPLDIQIRRRIIKHWINCHTLPRNHQFWRCRDIEIDPNGKHQSPFQTLAKICPINPETMEVIQPFAVAPYISGWEKAINLKDETMLESKQMGHRPRIEIYSCGSGRQGRLGIGLTAMAQDQVIRSVSKVVGNHKNINMYLTQLGSLLEAITMAMELLNAHSVLKRVLGVTIYTNSQTALKSVCIPRHQSGQALIMRITDQLRQLQERGIDIRIQWLPTHSEKKGAQLAKEAAARATEEEWPFYLPDWADTQLKSSSWRWRRESLQQTRVQQFKKTIGGNYTKEIDSALPGNHIKRLYDQLTRHQAVTLIQLRTGHIPLNWFLHRIGKADSSTCECSESPETVKHFLFDCRRWEDVRTEMKSVMGQRYGDLSYALGGRSPTDRDKHWTPNLEVVKRIIQFTIQTGRLNQDKSTHRDN